jgi:ATP-binding cassette subfamily D (ALD) protein 1
MSVNIRRFLKRLRNYFYLLNFLYENQTSSFTRFLIKSGFLFALALLLVKTLKKLSSFFLKNKTNRKALTQTKNFDKNNNLVLHVRTPKPAVAPAVNKQFFKELLFIVKIMFPRLVSKQSALLLLHTLTLICRTFLSIYVAKLEGLLTKNIVQKDFKSFAKKLIEWLLIALPATSCNSLIKFLESKLDLELKSQLVQKSHKLYFSDRRYYRIALKNSENVQIDQNLTEDLDKLSQLCVHLYSSLTKPILDITLITVTLISLAKSKNFNYLAPTSIGFLVIIITSILIRKISPKFGKMAADVAKQKGFLRFLYARIQMNSEEIAFYGGEKTEAALVNKNYKLLKRKMEHVYVNKFWYIIVEQFLLKYVWSAAGLSMISLPLLLSDVNGSNQSSDMNEGNEISQRTEEFTMAKNLLNSAADAVERIMTSYKEIIELTGFTRRVYEMFHLFDTLNERRISTLTNNTQDEPYQKSKYAAFESMNVKDLSRKNGTVYESSDQTSILVENISVITPNGDVIVPSLSLKIEQGMNLLITGPNGCGKSSL